MATATANSALNYARENQQRFLSELKDLLRIPSVSTEPERKQDVRRAAEVVADDLKRIGFGNVEVVPTQGHPLVYGEWLHAAGKPTVLCYAHYDVQPAEPLDEWTSPPCEPTERNQNLYARGAVDDKGQLWMQLKAFESLMKSGGGKLPINVKVLIEGEEEVGGESIEAYVRQQKDKLKADFALVTDTELFAPDLHKTRIAALLEHYPFANDKTLAYFRTRLVQAPADVAFGLDYVLRHAQRRDQQEACLAALRFKTDVLWAQLDALHHAYVTPALIPPGAFVPEDMR